MTDTSREGYIEAKVIARAKRDGWFCRKVQWLGRVAAPDRLFIKGGRHVWIEFKRSGKDATEPQKREHKRMRDAGCEVHVCDSITDAAMILR